MDVFKMEDIRQTKEWARYLRECNRIVKKVPTVPPPRYAAGATQPRGRNLNVFIKKIPLTPFSMMKIQRFHGKLDLSSLNEIKRKHKIVYSVVEPASATPGVRRRRNTTPGETFAGWKVNKKPFLPTKTIVIDLANNEKQLWKNLSTNAKRILKQKDSTNDSSDEKSRIEFYEAWKGSSKTWLMGEERFNKLLDAFGEKASLWISESKDKLLSGIILLESSDTANYFQTWTSKEGRKLGAHYHLVWRVILECKKRGLKWFDFEGIFDERWPIKKWAGFSEFKKKFGGRVVTYPGSFMRWF